MTFMARIIGLVGHCGPDSYMLRSAVKYAVADSDVQMLNDDGALDRALEAGAALLLINRVLDGAFDHGQGVELVKKLKESHPGVRTMLVSNFADAQAAAVAAGALEGFGKSEIGSAKMKQRLADAFKE
jgi:two-component system, chemotaxis family, chemotaxis protein CheY